MLVLEKSSKLSKNGCDEALLNCICENYDQIECVLNGDEYKEPKKHNRNFCMDCNVRMTADCQKSNLVCRSCGLCEYFLVYLASYSPTMKPSRKKCIYKKSDNFKVALNQFFYGGKQLVPDYIMKAIRNGIHDGTNILYNYTIPITIPILECILKRNELIIYKSSVYYIYFKQDAQLGIESVGQIGKDRNGNRSR